MKFGKYSDDPTARRRRAPEDVLAGAQEIIRRYTDGQTIRAIARDMGLARTSVDRVVKQYQEALDAQAVDDADAEINALLARWEGGTPQDFTLEDADPELVADLRAAGIDVEHPETLSVLAALTAHPTDELARYRLQHVPRTAEWHAERTPHGRLKTEQAEIDAKLAAGWRYRDGAWHPPVGEGLDWRGRADW